MKQKISNYIEQIRGVSYKPKDLRGSLDDNSIILLRANNINDGEINFDDVVYVDRKVVKEYQIINNGDILICASSGSKNLVGKAAQYYGEIECTFGAFCKLVRPVNIDEKYLGSFFQSKYYRDNISKASQGANINNIRNEHIDCLDIEILSEDDQNKVSNEIDTITDILRLKRKELSLLDELVKSRFIELFGDPAYNPKNFNLKKYGELFELNAGGTPSKNNPDYWNEGTISWIGSNMCQNEVIYKNDGKYITEEGFKHSSARMFPIDTVLIALVGATIGKTALLKFETTTNQNVLGVRNIKESGYNPVFVYYYTQFLNYKFLNIGNGGFNMASKCFVSELQIYEVDIELQNLFAEFVEKVDKSKFICQQKIKYYQELLDKKMDEYFNAEAN